MMNSILELGPVFHVALYNYKTFVGYGTSAFAWAYMYISESYTSDIAMHGKQVALQIDISVPQF